MTTAAGFAAWSRTVETVGVVLPHPISAPLECRPDTAARQPQVFSTLAEERRVLRSNNVDGEGSPTRTRTVYRMVDYQFFAHCRCRQSPHHAGLFTAGRI